MFEQFLNIQFVNRFNMKTVFFLKKKTHIWKAYWLMLSINSMAIKTIENFFKKLHTSLIFVCTAAFCRIRSASTPQMLKLELFVGTWIILNYVLSIVYRTNTSEKFKWIQSLFFYPVNNKFVTKVYTIDDHLCCSDVLSNYKRNFFCFNIKNN